MTKDRFIREKFTRERSAALAQSVTRRIERNLTASGRAQVRSDDAKQRRPHGENDRRRDGPGARPSRRRHLAFEVDENRIVLEGLRGEENISELCRRKASQPRCITAGRRSSWRLASAPMNQSLHSRNA